MPSRTTFRTSFMKPPAYCALPRICLDSIGSRPPTSVPRRRQRTASIFRNPHASSFQSKLRKAEASSWHSRTMIGFRMKNNALRLCLFALALTLGGCSFNSQPALPSMRANAALRILSQTGTGKIKHVIYIVQENRSFDDLFQAYPGADTVSKGKNSKGQTVVLKPASLATQYV